MTIGKINIETGARFGKLTVLAEGVKKILPSAQINRTVDCLCDCGVVKNIRLVHLVRNKTKSCGCTVERHGKRTSRLYTIWRGMKNRCSSEKHIDAHRYKLRGISICEEWKGSFTAFNNWAIVNGYKDGLQVDRIINSGDYCPSNCRFVSTVINANNRDVTKMIEYNGKQVSLKLLLIDKNLSNHYAAIYGRIERGWNPQEAIDTKIKEGRYKRNKPTETFSEGAICL